MKLTLAAILLFSLLRPNSTEAVDPESMCATQDAHRIELKPGIGFLEPRAEIYTRKPSKTRIATCELRANGRTIFQRYDGDKVVQRGFFLEGKRSGRWSDGSVVTIYAGGVAIQTNPATLCDPVAKIGLAYTVYCPRTTPWRAMLADFRTWHAAMNPKMGAVFDVYAAAEAKTPDSKAAYRAIPEHSDANVAVFQFMGKELTELMCIPPGENKLRSCLAEAQAVTK